jgi:uncharacterized DUF497 family protein
VVYEWDERKRTANLEKDGATEPTVEQWAKAIVIDSKHFFTLC